MAASERDLNLSEFVREALEENLKKREDPPFDIGSLLQAAGDKGVYEVVFRTKPRPQPSKRGDPAGK
jgi:hypothetical protein